MRKWVVNAGKFKNKLIFISLLLTGITFSSFTSTSQDRVNFVDESWLKARKQAKEEGKLLFVFVSATDCNSCKKMMSYVFNDSDIASYFNKNFVNYQMDANKPINNMVVSSWGLEGTPGLVFINHGGVIVYKTQGYHSSDELLEAALEANGDN